MHIGSIPRQLAHGTCHKKRFNFATPLDTGLHNSCVLAWGILDGRCFCCMGTDLVRGCLSDEHAAERDAQIMRRNLQAHLWRSNQYPGVSGSYDQAADCSTATT